jgi:hypothetical protein
MDSINKDATDSGLSELEQNWELLSVLGMSWSEIKSLEKEEREFLLQKTESVKEHIKKSVNPQ